ncbi:glycosyltransferase [Candidatus Micrarchaeota archaeon]|nr:glycosyltransferase [Candidatus Micrarchaeota archaeon]
MRKLRDYEALVGEAQINETLEAGARLSEKTVAHVNATFYGGGVAEMLNSYIPLLNDAGLRTEWRLLKGNREFFTVTKKMHNALQGARVKLTTEDLECYESTLDTNAAISNLNYYDCVVVDDPQPCGLIALYSRKSPSLWKPLPEFLRLPVFQKKQPWVWRVHLDLSNPNLQTWNYLKGFVNQYDAVVVSSKRFRRKTTAPNFVIPPAIDPLSEKNRELTDAQVDKILNKHGIDTTTQIITQVSRFDKWKDPLGVIKAFNKVRKEFKCQLVLIGSMATDDPEGEKTFNDVHSEAQKYTDVTLITVQNDLLVNALQRKSAVVVQKSLREGFGLTVSEALWKGTPVIGGDAGGIPTQIENGINGFLVRSIEQCANRIGYLLNNPKKAVQMGLAGREKVRREFLVTRLVRDELKMYTDVISKAEYSRFTKVPKQVLSHLKFAQKFFPFKLISKISQSK